MTTFRPLHDRVLVRPIDSDDKTAGGIIIPDTAQEKPSEGEVLATGPGDAAKIGARRPTKSIPVRRPAF